MDKLKMAKFHSSWTSGQILILEYGLSNVGSCHNMNEPKIFVVWIKCH